MIWVEYNELVLRDEKGRVSKQLDSEEVNELQWIDKTSHVKLDKRISCRSSHSRKRIGPKLLPAQVSNSTLCCGLYLNGSKVTKELSAVTVDGVHFLLGLRL